MQTFVSMCLDYGTHQIKEEQQDGRDENPDPDSRS